MVGELCFEVSGIKNLIDSYFQGDTKKLFDTRDHVYCPNFVTKLTLKTSLDHKDNFIHLGSLLVSYFSATHTLIQSGNRH